MTHPVRGAAHAALRLAAVAAALLLFAVWWRYEKQPDFRADRRVVLRPDAAAGASERVVLGGVPRMAWTLADGRALRFELTVPGEDPVLRLAEGATDGVPALDVRLVTGFGVRREAGAFDATPGAWTLRRVPLPAEPGEELTLELSVPAERGTAGRVAIADVVLESGGRGVDETETLLTGWAQADELLARASGERRAAPAVGERLRAGVPGPTCTLLEAGRALGTLTERVPAPGRIELVLHVVKPFPDGPSSHGRVRLRLGDETVGAVPVTLPDGVLVRETLTEIDAAPWAGGPLDVRLELEGAANLWVGVRELSVAAPRQVTRRPFDPRSGRNVLLVVVDGLRADRLGCYGHPGAATPRLDALAARGGRWDRVLAPGGWSLPNLGTLLTGVSPLTHGLGLAAEGRLSRRLPTLAQTAGWSGITTAAWTSSPQLTGRTGLNRGYQAFGFEPVPAQVLVEHALDWLVDAGQYRWFLTLHLTDLVPPYRASERDRAAVPADPPPGLVASLRRLDSRPGAAEAMAAEVGRPYDAALAGVDRALGTLLDALAERELLERTLVCVVGSVGEEFYDHGGRQQGQSLHDEIVRVPVLAAGPGIRSGTGTAFVEEEPIELVDVTRMLAYHGQLSSLATLQGRMPPPFAPSLADPVSHAILRPVPGVTELSLDASRSRRWLRVYDRGRLRESLYDLLADPHARHDLLADGGDATARFQADSLAQAFADWHRACVAASAGTPELLPLEAP